jgi:hypothetical protein
MAKELEARSEADDYDYIIANNSQFLTKVNKVVEDIRLYLVPPSDMGDKPSQDFPDPELLSKLNAACQSYDMDGVDEAMKELDKYSYVRSNDLIAWLKEKVEQTSFGEITEKLDALAGGAASQDGSVSMGAEGLAFGSAEQSATAASGASAQSAQAGKSAAPAQPEPEKPTRDYPDRVVLKRLAMAADSFDVDAVDNAVDELSSFNYENEAELVEWIKTKVNSMDFQDVNDRLMEMVTQVISSGNGQKPVKDSPDPEILKRLCQACQTYDMDGVDGAISELEMYNYDHDSDLTPWLREKINQMEFDSILERLSSL